MKKKLLAILLILVLAFTAIVATACVKNKERDLKQVTAKVTYAGRTSQVDKLELNSAVYNYVYMYYSYYAQGYLSQASYQSILNNIGPTFNQMNEELAETEAYTLKCIDELYNLVLANGTEEEKAAAKAASTVGKKYNVSDRIKEIVSILPKKHLIAAIEAYNEEMQSSLDGYLDEYESELEKASAGASIENVKEVTIISAPWKLTYEKGETLNESGLKVGAVYEGQTEPVVLDRSDFTVTDFSSDEIAEDVEVTVTFANKTATFKVAIVAEKPSRSKLPTEEEEEEKTEVPKLFEVNLAEEIAAVKTTDSARYKALSEAKRRLEKQIGANYRNYEFYYLAKLKTQVVAAYEEIVGEDSSTVSEAQLIEEYQKRLEEQKQALLLGSTDYRSAMNGTDVKTQIVHEDGKVFYVYNLLFKVTDDLKELYTKFESEKVASEEALEAYLNTMINRTGIYVSNVEYDKDAECEEENCTCTACVNYTGENPGECTDENCTCVKCPNKRFITKAFAEENGLTYDEETETINILEMRNALYADLAELSKTATTEERLANLEKFKKWIYMVNDDPGTFTALSDGKLGYSSVQMEDTSEGEWDKNFVALSKALAYGTAAEKAEWEIVGEGIGSFGWCYSSFGIHVVMLSGYALPEEYVNDDDDDYKIEGTDYYALPMGAITDYPSYKAEEENAVDEQVVITPAEGTLAYNIVESIKANRKDELVGNFKKNFYQKTLKNDVKISYNKKVYKDLIENYKK